MDNHNHYSDKTDYHPANDNRICTDEIVNLLRQLTPEDQKDMFRQGSQVIK
uniref:Uncharacterized protein n=1 Tax=Siphoviridae sp. ctFgp7 TaxID=2827821 RepID=A0A8S5ST79_9CAUD|nr:MAG TPA: hypothetical protein [Siphoviridae sp. ctFgp7]